jgi:hypothetical protein
MVSAILSVAFILLGISGILGAGGRRGNSISILGRRDGGVGKSGGLGKRGRSGIEKSKSISILYCGGSGRSGNFNNAILVGTKLNLGSKISIHKFILERSSMMFGILKGGMGRIGNPILGHNMDKLQV